ncbi:MAG: hypothetical protein Q9202_000299 [Teloschistes flavicans]
MSGSEAFVPAVTDREESLGLQENETTARQEPADEHLRPMTESQFLPSAGCDEAPRAGYAEEEPKYITPYTPTGVNPEWSKERD